MDPSVDWAVGGAIHHTFCGGKKKHPAWLWLSLNPNTKIHDRLALKSQGFFLLLAPKLHWMEVIAHDILWAPPRELASMHLLFLWDRIDGFIFVQDVCADIFFLYIAGISHMTLSKSSISTNTWWDMILWVVFSSHHSSTCTARVSFGGWSLRKHDETDCTGFSEYAIEFSEKQYRAHIDTINHCNFLESLDQRVSWIRNAVHDRWIIGHGRQNRAECITRDAWAKKSCWRITLLSKTRLTTNITQQRVHPLLFG